METFSIRKSSPLRGEVQPPADKSISHRAIILGALSQGRSTVKNFLRAEDPLTTIAAFRQMGVEIEDKGEEIIIDGKGLTGLKEPSGIIDCGNSGTTMRLLCGVLAGQPFSATLSGDDSLRRRPMQRVIKPLVEMGARITSQAGGYPPLTIQGGGLTPVNYKSTVASAQVKSAILLAGLYCDGVTTISEPDKSRDHTERMLKAQGAGIEIKNLEISIKGRASLNPFNIIIPADFSSAAFFLVAGAIVPDSEIVIKNVGINPTRTGLLDILHLMGADIETKNEHEVSGEPVADLHVRHSSLRGVTVGGDLILKAIDEFPILCVAASLSEGVTKITGAEELRVKESDRIKTMAEALRKAGVDVEELKDGIIIKGRNRLKPASIQSHGDHRVAMSMAIAGLMADGETIIEDTTCVNTSFPKFMEMLEGLAKAK
ncbi:MAG: 3-phosphoshikimate 1-carboxyvinyltransferase [Nitrospirae bacterium]|nr:3-phosphoshikimate 1-carboxyvinyltransferase [Nitrospirota bacterium]